MKRVVNIALCLSLIGALACAPTYAQSRSGSSSRSGGSHSSSSYSSRSSGSHSSSSHSSSGYHSSGSSSHSSSSRSSYSSSHSSPSRSSYSGSSSSRSYGSSSATRSYSSSSASRSSYSSSATRPSGSYSSSATRSSGSSTAGRSYSSSSAPRSAYNSSASRSAVSSTARRSPASGTVSRSGASTSRVTGTAPGTRGTYTGPGSVRPVSNDRIHGTSSYTRQPGQGSRPGEIGGRPGDRPGGPNAGPRPGNRPPGGPRPGAFIPHDRPAPFHGHHHHCYGCRIHSLPYGYVRHIWHDIVFYECAGVFYRCIAGEYFVCRPPYGYIFAPSVLTVAPAPIIINVTPSAPQPTIQNTASAVNYYYEDGVFFYLNADGQYEVIEAPVGAIVEYLPEDFETVVIDGKELYKVDYTLFKTVVLQGKPMFEVVGTVGL